MVEKWLVCFVDSRSWGWWNVFTFFRKKFSHTFALRYNSLTESWILFEWSSKGLIVDTVPRDYVACMLSELKENGVVMEIEKKDHPISFPLLPLYCVSPIRHLCGIKKLCLTPYSLYCELQKNGGVFKFGTENNI